MTCSGLLCLALAEDAIGKKIDKTKAATKAGYAWLAVILALNAVLAAFYYLRVVVHMYMYDVDAAAPRLLPSRLLSVSLGVTAVAVVVLGIVPNSLYQWALNASAPILP